MINLNIQKLIWEQEIRNEYAKYQIFIGDSNMPKYKVNFIDSTKTKVSYSMEVLTQKNPMILNVNMGFLVGKNGKHCQPNLYHEFTHMWDCANLFISEYPLSRSKFLSLYTEYHASQIEILRFIECGSIDNIRNITPIDEFFVFDKKISAIDYYLNVCRFLFEKSCIYKSCKIPENYKYLMDAYMYVFRIKNVYDKYINNIEVPRINDIFYEYMVTVYSLFQKYRINELLEPLLQHIDTLDIIFAKDFINSQQ